MPNVARDIALREVVAVHEKMSWIHVAVVMPDHVHMVTQPLWDERGISYPLPDILKTIKGRSARFINLAIGRHGTVWLQESNDHEIRAGESLTQKIDCVLLNPVRKGLARTPVGYPWIWRWWIEGTKTG